MAVFPGLTSSTKKLAAPAGETSLSASPVLEAGSGGVSVPSRVEAKETEVFPEAGCRETARTLDPLSREELGRVIKPEEIGVEMSLRALVP